jgi:protein-S-isoprenylcysteine O-methyltransferase Ste14
MIKNEKAFISDNDQSLKPPKLFIWMASVVTVSLIVTTQFLPRGSNQYLRGIGVFTLLLGGVFNLVPFYLLSKHGGRKSGGTYLQAVKVVDRGLYAITRHPQYLGYVFLDYGFSFLSQHWAVFLLAIIGNIFFYLQVIQEEKHCLNQFGDQYKQYLQRVPRFNILVGILRLIKGWK